MFEPKGVLGDELIEAIKVKVCKELACQIADGKAAPPPIGLKQIVIRKVESDRLLRIRMIDDGIHQP